MWVFLLCFGVSLDDGQKSIGLCLALKDGVRPCIAARNDDDVPFTDALLGLCQVEVCSEGSSLCGDNMLGKPSEGAFEGVGV